MDKRILLLLAVVVLAFVIYSESQGGIADVVENAFTGNLSAAQLAALASEAGFTGDDLTTAVAVALAESSGNPNAYNPETAAGAPVNKGSYGLWQIYLNAHPEFAGLDLYDPQTNANAAFDIYDASGGFSAWSTFKSGAYLAYIGTAQNGVTA